MGVAENLMNMSISKTPVMNEEVLYRCVRHGRKLKVKQPDGTFKLSSQAFADPYNRPSVYRAALCNNDPSQAQIESKDGVVSVVTHDVRLTDSVVQRDPKGRIIHKFNVDVEHVPEPENYSHAEIYIDPASQSRGVILRLMERLAYLANQRLWEIELRDS